MVAQRPFRAGAGDVRGLGGRPGTSVRQAEHLVRLVSASEPCFETDWERFKEVISCRLKRLVSSFIVGLSGRVYSPLAILPMVQREYPIIEKAGER